MTVDDATEAILPEDAGLSVDYAASVAAAGGEQSWSPRRLWDYYTGGERPRRRGRRRRGRVAATIDELTESVGTPAKDGSWTFANNRLQATDPVVGRGIDPASARGRHRGGVPHRRRDAELAMTDLQPDIDDADMREAQESFVNPAMSGPVTLLFGDSKVQLRPRDYLRTLSLEPQDGELVPTLDTAQLVGAGGRQDQRRGRTGRRHDQDRRRQAEGDPGQARRHLRPRRRRGPLPRAGGGARGGARGGGQGHGRPGRLHHQGRAGPEDPRGGLVVHHLLPLRRLPQHQHRPRRRADQRHGARARRGVLPQRHRRRAHRRERFRARLHHQQRHLQGGLRRRRLADGDHDLQRHVLRRPEGHRAQAALLLHRPLPGGPGGDGGLADRST